MPRLIGSTALLLVSLLASRANAHGAPAELVKARQLVFGVENVDARTGAVDRDKVIFSWLTNATLAASIKGHIVLLDTFVHRAEIVPGRTPFVVEDLVSLSPEAAFIGHGHGDHADNAAWLGAKLGIPLFASEETCMELRADAVRFVGTGALTSSTIDCRNVTSAGSHPGAELVKIDVLEPVASITAFRHLHSGTSYPQSSEPVPFAITPVKNVADPRDADMYPPGVAHSFRTSGPIGGPISIYYHFVVRGDHNFTFAWHNTTGDLHHGCTIDHQPPACWDDMFPSELISANVKARIAALPETDVEFGSFVSLGFAVNGMRDPIENSATLKPKVYVPIHQTNAALPTSSLYFKVAYLKPMVYDPNDARWSKGRRSREHDDDHDD